MLYHDRAYPVTKIHKYIYTKGGKRLCKLGVLKREYDLESAFPSIILPNTMTVRFVSKFREVNKRFVRNL